MTGLTTRFATIRDTIGPLCVGIDPSQEALSSWGLADGVSGVVEFSRVLVSAATGRVGIVKPQVAYFERFGSAGLAALETVMREARQAGLAVIADAKRGDIGSTMDGYAAAWLGDGPLASDAMTASPYLGVGALEPAIRLAESSGATVFVLAATSNPEAETVQRAQIDGVSLPAAIARAARERNHTVATVGLVVGATRPLAQSGLSDADVRDTLVLAPGFGAQGARLSDLRQLFGDAHHTVIPSVSRSVTSYGPDAVARSIDAHRRELGT